MGYAEYVAACNTDTPAVVGEVNGGGGVPPFPGAGSRLYSGVAPDHDTLATPAYTYGWSIEFWAKPDGLRTNPCAVTVQGMNSTNQTLCYVGESDLATARMWHMSDTSLAYEDDTLANTWHHYVFTRSGSQYATTRLYVDGVQRDTGGSAEIFSPTALRVGGNSTFAQYFKGEISQVRYYGAELSAARIQAHYNAAMILPRTVAAPQSFATGDAFAPTVFIPEPEAVLVTTDLATATAQFLDPFLDLNNPDRLVEPPSPSQAQGKALVPEKVHAVDATYDAYIAAVQADNPLAHLEPRVKPWYGGQTIDPVPQSGEPFPQAGAGGGLAARVLLPPGPFTVEGWAIWTPQEWGNSADHIVGWRLYALESQDTGYLSGWTGEYKPLSSTEDVAGFITAGQTPLLSVNWQSRAYVLKHTDPFSLANAWHHYAWSHDGLTNRLYIDGNLVMEEPSIYPHQGFPWFVLRFYDPFLQARRNALSQFSFYGKALAPGRIKAHYEAAKNIPPSNVKVSAPTGSATGKMLRPGERVRISATLATASAKAIEPRRVGQVVLGLVSVETLAAQATAAAKVPMVVTPAPPPPPPVVGQPAFTFGKRGITAHTRRVKITVAQN